MKNLSRFLLTLLATAVACAACSDDNPEPGPGTEKPVPGENEYGCDGRIEKIRSVYVTSNDSQTAVLLSPQEGLKTYQDFTSDGVSYLLFQMDKSLTGKPIDVKTETADYLFDNRSGIASTELTQFDRTSWSTCLSDGTFRIDVGEREAGIDFSFTLLSGAVFQGTYKGGYVAPEPTGSDFYTYDGTRTELESVLVTTQDGMIYMYMSPDKGLTTRDDFTASGNYLLLGVSESLADREIDVTTAEQGWAFYNKTALGHDVLETLDPYTWEDVVTEGTILLSLDETTALASFGFTTLDGKRFTGFCSGDYQAPLGENNYTFNGQTVDLKSAFYLSQGEIEYLYLSPQEGLTTVEEFSEAEYLLIGIEASLEGQNVDVLTTNSYCSFFNITKLGGKEFEGGDSDSWEEVVTRGELMMKVVPGRAAASFSFTLPSGELFEGSYAGPYAQTVVPDDAFLLIDDEEVPVRAAFYERTADGVAFYLTSGEITSAVDLEDVIRYVRLYVSNALLNEEVDIETANRPFEFTYIDNLTGENVTIENGDTQGAAGFFRVMEKDCENDFLVEFEMDGVGGHLINGIYDGEFADYDLTIPNEYALGEEAPTPIRSALIDKSDAARYAFYFSAEEGVTTVAGMRAADPVVCYLKPDQLTGNIMGFSFSPDLRIDYRGVTYDQASTSGDNGLANGGNIAATLEGDQATVEFNVYFIKEFEATLHGHYEGSVTVVN